MGTKPSISKARASPASSAWPRMLLPYSKTMAPSSWKASIAPTWRAMLAFASVDVAVGIAGAKLDRLGEAVAGGNIAVERIVRRGLVGDHRRGEAHASRSAGKSSAALPISAMPSVSPFAAASLREPHRLGRVVDDHVAVAHRDAPLGPRRVDLDGDADAARHLHRQRLRAAHAAEPGGQHDAPAEIARREALARRGEGLVGALEDALRADIGPGAGRVLAVHDQALGLERAVDRPGRPFADEVGVGGEHFRAHRRGAEHRDRLARLDDQRLVVAERLQRRDDGVEAFPVPRRRAPSRHRRSAPPAFRRWRACSRASAGCPPAASPCSGACRAPVDRDVGDRHDLLGRRPAIRAARPPMTEPVRRGRGVDLDRVQVLLDRHEFLVPVAVLRARPVGDRGHAALVQHRRVRPGGMAGDERAASPRNASCAAATRSRIGPVTQFIGLRGFLTQLSCGSTAIVNFWPLGDFARECRAPRRAPPRRWSTARSARRR